MYNILQEEQCKLYLSLKAMSESRLTPASFSEWNVKLSRKVAIRRKIFMVPKDNPLPDDVLIHRIPAEHVEHLPLDVDTSAFWLIDSCVQQHKLGPGVSELEVSSEATQKSTGMSPPIAAASSSSLPLHMPIATTMQVESEPTRLQIKDSEHKGRCLEREPSTPDDRAAEAIATFCKASQY